MELKIFICFLFSGFHGYAQKIGKRNQSPTVGKQTVHPNGDSKCLLYADDTIVYASAALPVVTSHVRIITNYLNRWGIETNYDKCQLICFRNASGKGHRQAVPESRVLSMDMDGHKLNCENVVRYLGVYLHHRFKFNLHARKVLSKAKGVSGILRPLLSARSVPKKTKLLLKRWRTQLVFFIRFSITKNDKLLITRYRNRYFVIEHCQINCRFFQLGCNGSCEDLILSYVNRLFNSLIPNSIRRRSESYDFFTRFENCPQLLQIFMLKLLSICNSLIHKKNKTKQITTSESLEHAVKTCSAKLRGRQEVIFKLTFIDHPKLLFFDKLVCEYVLGARNFQHMSR